MSFCQLHWPSQILGRQTTTWVLLPDKGTPPFPTFYLLHGLSDDHTAWIRKTRINDYVADLPLIVVMPDGGRGFYTNHAQGPAWATHMAEELPALIEKTFPAKTNRQGRCIGGLSMGGYGALRLALGYPDRYISANSHSGAVLGPNEKRLAQFPGEFQNIVGPGGQTFEHDLMHLAKQAQTRGLVPKIQIDCGTEDFLLDDNRTLHRALSNQKIEHTYNEFPGVHSWQYWDIHVQEALAFHAKHLEIMNASPTR